MEFRLKDILRKHRTLLKILLLIPGIVAYYLLNADIIHNAHVVSICGRLSLVYLTVITILIANSILLGFEDAYSRSGKYKEHPLKGLVQAIQIAIYFIGCIIIVAVLIDKSPSALLAGLGASAAVLMLVFKDSILGFVAGVMLFNPFKTQSVLSITSASELNEGDEMSIRLTDLLIREKGFGEISTIKSPY